MSKRLMPTYLIEFLRSGYNGDVPANFGKRLVSRQAIAFTKKLYDIFVGTGAPVNFGSRMLPEYLVKYLDDLRSSDFIVFEDDDTAFIKDVPDISDISCKINIIGGMSYKVEAKGVNVIQDSAVTSVVSKDASNNTVDTITINANIQALTGYGWGINNTCYNCIDFENKKFIQKVGRVDLGSLNWEYQALGINQAFVGVLNNLKSATYSEIPNYLSTIYTAISRDTVNNNVVDLSICTTGATTVGIINNTYTIASDFKTAMSGVYLYYELATPVETDISSYIDTNIIDIKENGTLTFTNTYDQAVPSSVDYYIPKEAFSNGN